MRTLPTPRRVASVSFVILLVALAPVAAVAAQDDPGQPIAFHGTAVADGVDAPEGTTIVAAVDGKRVDSIDVPDTGEYARAEPTAEKLRTTTAAGNEVTFHIATADGTRAEETHDIGGSGVFEINLTFPAGEFDTVRKAESVGGDGTAEVSFPAPEESEGVSSSTVSGLPQGTTVAVEPAPGPTGKATKASLQETPLQEDAVFIDIDASTEVNTDVDIAVEVDETRLSAFSDPVLYHFVNGDWRDLETSIDGNQLSATATGLSPFAIGEAEQESIDDGGGSDGGAGGGSAGETGGGTPGGTDSGTGSVVEPLELSRLVVSGERLASGDPLSVTVQLTSTTVGNQTEEIRLTLDDELLSTRTVTLAEGTRNLTFDDIRIDEPTGAYVLRVASDDTSLETAIQVVEQRTETQTPPASETVAAQTEADVATTGGDGGTDSRVGGPAIALILGALLILVLAGLTAMARR